MFVGASFKVKLAVSMSFGADYVNRSLDTNTHTQTHTRYVLSHRWKCQLFDNEVTV